MGRVERWSTHVVSVHSTAAPASAKGMYTVHMGAHRQRQNARVGRAGVGEACVVGLCARLLCGSVVVAGREDGQEVGGVLRDHRPCGARHAEGHAARRAVPRTEGATTARLGLERLAVDLQQWRACHMVCHMNMNMNMVHMHIHLHLQQVVGVARVLSLSLSLSLATLTTCSRS